MERQVCNPVNIFIPWREKWENPKPDKFMAPSTYAAHRIFAYIFHTHHMAIIEIARAQCWELLLLVSGDRSNIDWCADQFGAILICFMLHLSGINILPFSVLKSWVICLGTFCLQSEAKCFIRSRIKNGRKMHCVSYSWTPKMQRLDICLNQHNFVSLTVPLFANSSFWCATLHLVAASGT